MVANVYQGRWDFVYYTILIRTRTLIWQMTQCEDDPDSDARPDITKSSNDMYNKFKGIAL